MTPGCSDRSDHLLEDGFYRLRYPIRRFEEGILSGTTRACKLMATEVVPLRA